MTETQERLGRVFEPVRKRQVEPARSLGLASGKRGLGDRHIVPEKISATTGLFRRLPVRTGAEQQDDGRQQRGPQTNDQRMPRFRGLGCLPRGPVVWWTAREHNTRHQEKKSVG